MHRDPFLIVLDTFITFFIHAEIHLLRLPFMQESIYYICHSCRALFVCRSRRGQFITFYLHVAVHLLHCFFFFFFFFFFLFFVFLLLFFCCFFFLFIHGLLYYTFHSSRDSFRTFFVYAGIHLSSANKLYGLLNNRIMKEVKQTRRDNCCVGYVNNPKDLPQHLSKSW